MYKIRDWILDLDICPDVFFKTLSYNPHPTATLILRNNKKNINWSYLSYNCSPEAIKLLKENPDKIDYSFLSIIINKNPDALKMLKEYLINLKKIISFKNFWLDDKLNKIHWCEICRTPSQDAIDILKKYTDKINYYTLSSNTHPEAIKMVNDYLINLYNKYNFTNIFQYVLSLFNLYKFKNKFNWDNISCNSSPEAVNLLRKYPDKIMWNYLSQNTSPEAIELLKENPHMIDWKSLSFNNSNEAIKLLKENPDKIDWKEMSGNTNNLAVDFLKENPDKIDWDMFSSNESDSAIYFMKENPHKIVWFIFSYNSNPLALNIFKEYKKHINPNELINHIISVKFLLELSGITLIKKNINIVCEKTETHIYKTSSQNYNVSGIIQQSIKKNKETNFLFSPMIFVLDYDALKQRISPFKEELIARAYHPKRVAKWIEMDDNIDVVDL